LNCSAAHEVAQQASTIICIVEPTDWRIYITPVLVFLSTLIAIAAIRNARRVAREKATIDLIEKVESGEHYRQIAQTFSRFRQGPGFVRPPQ
jgi:xanthine dehydrogenase iron-sulfur cluster and FAD-binding subunit A